MCQEGHNISFAYSNQQGRQSFNWQIKNPVQGVETNIMSGSQTLSIHLFIMEKQVHLMLDSLGKQC